MSDEKYRRRWGRIWIAWLIAVAASFAALEGTALAKRKEGDTLSEQTRRWAGTDRTWKTWGALGFTGVVAGFAVWFIPHIVFRLW